MSLPTRDTQARPLGRCVYTESEEILKARQGTEQNPSSADAWKEYGMALAKESILRESVEAFAQALSLAPFRGDLYLERGHRHLNLAELHEASADLEMASYLDPQSWDVYYHLGLAHYILGEYELAEKAFRFGLRLSDADIQVIPMTNWCWATLMHAGKRDEAMALLAPIHENMDADYNAGYLQMLLLYKGERTPEQILPDGVQASVDHISAAYGISNYLYFVKGDEAASDAMVDAILDTGRQEVWNSFAYLSCMNEKARRAKA